MAKPSEYHIHMRRMQEDRLRAGMADRQAAMRLNQRAEFEIRTTSMIKARTAKEKVLAAQKAARARLDTRRRRLADLFDSERMGWQSEIEASFETGEQRKERLFAHAKDLQRKREAERLRQVEELNERRWMEASDVARERDSKIRRQRIASEHKRQMDEMVAREAEASAREKELEAMMEEAGRRKDAEMQARVAEAMKRNEQTKKEIDAQVAIRKALKEAEKAKEVADDEATLADWRAERDRAEMLELEKKNKHAREHFLVTRMNEEAAKVRARQDAEERAADEARLRMVLEREAREEAEEKRLAAERRADALKNKAALEEQLAFEREAEDAQDHLFKMDADKAHAKRQAQWDAEEAARQRLMDDVARTRVVQMKEKADREAAERALERKYVEDTMAGLAIAKDKDAAEAEARRLAAKKAQDAILRQVSEKERKGKLEAQESWLESKLMRREEERYLKRVDKVLARAPPEVYHGRKKVEWYS